MSCKMCWEGFQGTMGLEHPTSLSTQSLVLMGWTILSSCSHPTTRGCNETTNFPTCVSQQCSSVNTDPRQGHRNNPEVMSSFSGSLNHSTSPVPFLCSNTLARVIRMPRTTLVYRNMLLMKVTIK